jgi:hypothetical protein
MGSGSKPRRYRVRTFEPKPSVRGFSGGGRSRGSLLLDLVAPPLAVVVLVVGIEPLPPRSARPHERWSTPSERHTVDPSVPSLPKHISRPSSRLLIGRVSCREHTCRTGRPGDLGAEERIPYPSKTHNTRLPYDCLSSGSLLPVPRLVPLPVQCRAWHGYMVTNAHRVEVEVGSDGHASAPPPGPPPLRRRWASHASDALVTLNNRRQARLGYLTKRSGGSMQYASSNSLSL